MAIPKIKSDEQANKLAVKRKEYSVPVAGVKGLTIRVRPNGKKDYRYRYTSPITGTRPTLTLGDVAHDKLSDIFRQIEIYEGYLNDGIDPKDIKKMDVGLKELSLPDNKFSTVAAAWIASKQAGSRTFSDSTIIYWERCVGYLNKTLGNIPIDKIDTLMLLNACQNVQKSGAMRTGQHMRQYAEDIYKFAITRKLATENTAKLIQGELLPVSSSNHHPALTNADEYASLIYDIYHIKDILPAKTKIDEMTIFALELLPHIYPRSIDLRSMAWSDISFNDAQWIFKPKKGLDRMDMVDELVVPLSAQVLEKLKQLKPLTGHLPFVFASLRDTKNQFLSRAPLNNTLDKLGYAGKHCPHGFRASAKTLQMELRELRYSDTVSELQLGHKIKDTHGNAYNRLDEIDLRTEMMQKWSDVIERMALSSDWSR